MRVEERISVIDVTIARLQAERATLVTVANLPKFLGWLKQIDVARR